MKQEALNTHVEELMEKFYFLQSGRVGEGGKSIILRVDEDVSDRDKQKLPNEIEGVKVSIEEVLETRF